MNWNSAADWQRWDGSTWVSNPGQGYPGQNSGTGLVTIRNGHTVTLNVSPANSIGSLTVGTGTSGTLTFGNNTNVRTLTVTNSVTVAANGTINVANNTVTHVFIIGGNVSNSGVFDLTRDGNSLCDATFNGTVNQTISGAGATTDFNRITINNSGAANNNIVEVMPSNFTAAGGFLVLTQGIIKMSGSYSFTNTFVPAVSSFITINADEGIWLNNANVTVTAQAADLDLYGLIRITAGTYNVGSASDWWFLYETGSVVTIEGGALNIASAFAGNTTGSTITYTQSNGTVTVNTAGNTGFFGGIPSFGIEAAGSVFNMSGGSIVVQRLNDAYTDYINASTNATVTGGTLQIGNASSPVPSFSYWVNSTAPLFNLVVNTTNTPTCELRVATTILNDVTIGGILDVSPNNVNTTVGRHWTNNGTFTPGTATVTFNGSVLQQISGSTTTAFNSLTLNNTAGNTTTGVSLLTPASVAATLTLTSGHLTSSATNLLTMNAGSTVAGANYATRTSGGSDNSFVNGPLRKTGNTNFLFPVGKVNAGHHFCGISSPGNIGDSYTAEYKRASATALGSVSAVGLHHVSNCEYWDISTTAGSPNVNVTLSWNGNSNCNAAIYVNDLGTLVAAHFAGTWNSSGGTTDAGSTVSAGSLTWNGVTTFSPFSLGSTQEDTNPLPVKLVDIKAWLSGNRNQVEWTNLTETDVLIYETERSLNGTSFTSFSSTNARSNSGDREEYITYDPQTDPVVYYRIKVVGTGGRIVYSPVMKVTGAEQPKQNLIVYPNPVTGNQLNIQLNSLAGNYQVRIFAANGQLVKTETWKHPGGSLSRSMELPAQLKPGQYFIHATGGEQVFTTRFIVQ